MEFDANNFSSESYGGLNLYLDRRDNFQTYFNHKTKRKDFPFYRQNIIPFLNENPEVKLYFTFNSEIKSFMKVDGGFLINMDDYQKFCVTIGRKTGGRLKAFLGQNISLENISLTNAQKDSLVQIHGNEKNFIEAIRKWPDDRKLNVITELQKELSSQGPVALVPKSEADIISELHGRDARSIINIIKSLSTAIPDLQFSKEDLNMVLKRREKLSEFNSAITDQTKDEGWWQDFFEKNKWIFGYGLNYQILKQEQSQPNYGGQHVDGQGGQRGDFLTSTIGDINFTVLVEIKKPSTHLLQGTNEIRNGAWSLSKELTDALSQIGANIQTWEKQGSEQPDNRDRFEDNNVYTVQPKGIIVIGLLGEIASERSKRETFQRFRKSIHGIDIITFDELYKRASFIVESRE